MTTRPRRREQPTRHPEHASAAAAHLPETTAAGTRGSPKVTSTELAAYGLTAYPPHPHTGTELAAVIGLVRKLCPSPPNATIMIGHSRDPASRAAAQAFAGAWAQHHRTATLPTIDWPETAASWQRQAARMTAHRPDAWVIAAAPLGFMQLARRLSSCPGWAPERVVAFASLHDARLPAITGSTILHGLCGATADGRTWRIRHRAVLIEPAGEAPVDPGGEHNR